MGARRPCNPDQRGPACLGKNTRPRDHIDDITLLAVYLIGPVGPSRSVAAPRVDQIEH
jgi:hypothetical protein